MVTELLSEFSDLLLARVRHRSGILQNLRRANRIHNAASRQSRRYASRPRISNGSTPSAPRIVFASTPRRTITPTDKKSQVLVDNAMLLPNHISSLVRQSSPHRMPPGDGRLLHDILDYTLLTIGSTPHVALAIHAAHLSYRAGRLTS